MVKPHPDTDTDTNIPSTGAVPAVPATGPSGLRRGLVRLAWVALWVPGALLALLLAGGLAFWLWAATPGSLGTTLGWAQDWMQENPEGAGQLNTEGVEGSLRGGGRIASLRWKQDELSVQASGVQLDWNEALWFDAVRGRGVHPKLIHIDQLNIDDQRPPKPTEPMESLTLPMEVSLAFAVTQLNLSGQSDLSISDIKGDYRYLPNASPIKANDTGIPELPATEGVQHAHRLRLESLRFADGQYSAGLNLGAEAPMPMVLALKGDIQTQVPDGAGVRLEAKAQVSGSLAGEQALLKINADAKGQPTSPAGGSPTSLNLQAQIRPWADQPVVSAEGSASALNLAALWPTAPTTDLSGQVQVRPEGDAWQAKLQLDNAKSGPADKNALPLKRLQASVEQRGTRWTISDLAAQLGGGEVLGKGSFQLDSSGESPVLSAWQGEVQAKGVRPVLIWSELAPGALDASLVAKVAPNERSPETVAVRASIKPSGRQSAASALKGMRLDEIRVNGQWQPVVSAVASAGMANGVSAMPNLGLFDIQEAHIGMADAQFNAKGLLDTANASYDGELRLQVPGAKVDTAGFFALNKGKGKATVDMQDSAGMLTWVRSLQTLPFLGEHVRAALVGQENLSLKGGARASLQWTGGLATLMPTAASPKGSASVKPAAPLNITASLEIPRLSVQTSSDGPIEIEKVSIQAQGTLNDLQLKASGGVNAKPWRAQWDTAGQWRGNTNLQDGGTVSLNSFLLSLKPSGPGSEASGIDGWSLQAGQPVQLILQAKGQQGMQLEVGSGELQLRPLSSLPPALSEPLIVAWQRLTWKDNALETQGRLQGLTLPWIDALSTFGQPKGNGPLDANGVRGDLVFDGAWNVTLPADAQSPMALSATLQRRSGDMQWLTNGGAKTVSITTSTSAGKGTSTSTSNAPASLTKSSPAANGNDSNNDSVAAGVKDARISLTVADRRLQALLRWDSNRLGQASAEFTTPLNRHNANDPALAKLSLIDRWWPANSPLSGSAQARLPQVGVWSMFAPPGWRMSGTLSADAKVSGTRSAPKWQGEVQADELALRSVVDGFAFTNGLLRATLDGERIQVNRFSLQGPGGGQSGGSLEATGQAEWQTVPGKTPGTQLRQPLITLKAKTERLRVSNRADRRLTLSGDVSAQLAGSKLELRGDLKVDSALYIMPDALAPSLSKDVVIRSTNATSSEDQDAQKVKPDVLVKLDLGQQFEVRGQGLTTRLSGQLTVRATPAVPTPRVMGEVRTVSGTYRAYGQQLNIENGVLRFTGPYDDPALDILAVRKLPENTDQRVGVQISGNVQAPRVGLFAEPDLPDADKLAWLVLGRPASAAGAQAFVLQQAARKLLSRGGEPTDGALAKTLGLDEVGFAGPSSSADGSTTEAALTVGKRLSDKLYLSYEQSLAGAVSTVSILYDLSKSFTLRARAGTENAVDVIFTHRYD